MGAKIISKWNLFYRGKKKLFLLPSLICALLKRVGVVLLDADEALPMDPPIHSLLVRTGSNSIGKRSRTSKPRSSMTTTGSDVEDPLYGARA